MQIQVFLKMFNKKMKIKCVCSTMFYKDCYYEYGCTAIAFSLISAGSQISATSLIFIPE